MLEVGINDIVQAYARVRPYVKQTPLIYSIPTSKQTGCEVWFKLENLQDIGAYKIRGAINNIMSMTEQELARGVVATSSGNHSQAVAYAAKLKGISAVVCVPESTPMTKREGALKYGAELVVYGSDYDLADHKAHEIERESGRKFVHAFESPETIAGQGTLAIECLLEQGDFDVILVPTGGGGLLDGVAIVAKALCPKVKVYGIQTETSPPWQKSFREKRLNNDVEFLPTVADGLEGAITWPPVELALRCGVDDILLVTEHNTRQSIKWMADKHHQIIEGAAATAVAAAFEYRNMFKGQKVLALITGGNIDLARLLEVCAEPYTII